MSEPREFQWVLHPLEVTIFDDHETHHYLQSSIEEKIHINKESDSIVTLKVILRLRVYKGCEAVPGGTISLYCEESIWLFDVLKQQKSSSLQRNERYRFIDVHFQKNGDVRITLHTKTTSGSILIPQNSVDKLIAQLTTDLPVIECKCRKAGLPADLTIHDCTWWKLIIKLCFCP